MGQFLEPSIALRENRVERMLIRAAENKQLEIKNKYLTSSFASLQSIFLAVFPFFNQRLIQNRKLSIVQMAFPKVNYNTNPKKFI